MSQRSKKSPSHNAATGKAKQSQLRIIGGQWRGRKLAIADVEGLRPSGDRIRETLFNWLTGDIADAYCLDCFAGTGALGLECLSRGAAETYFLEKHPLASKMLAQHLSNLTANNGKLIQQDCLEWIKSSSDLKNKIDLVFIDPPFSANLWDSTISALEHSQLLANDAIIYIESPKDTLLNTPAHWNLHREKFAGQICYRLFIRNG